MPDEKKNPGQVALDEFGIIAEFFAPLAKIDPHAFGLKDDAACIRTDPVEDLVVTTDALVAGVHFLNEDPPELIGKKLLRVNLSDLAAKGARPFAYLLTAALPKDVTAEWLARFSHGLAEDQDEFIVHLIGGDTVSTPGPMTASITAIGKLREGRMVRRKGARVGDGIYCTGTIGDAALGLILSKDDDPALSRLSRRARDYLIGRYRLPEPRVAFGPWLGEVATAALDVSDGLIADLGHLAENSSVRLVVEAIAVPLSPAATAAADMAPDRFMDILNGGDDYEIVFTAPDRLAEMIGRMAKELDLPITRIGRVEEGEGVELQDADGQPMSLDRPGYRHF